MQNRTLYSKKYIMPEKNGEREHAGEVVSKSLAILSKMERFSDWMYSQIRPYLGGRILEIGSGQGTYSERVVRDFPESDITLSDMDERYLAVLRERFAGARRVSVISLDMSRADHFRAHWESFDRIFALNVLEHIEDDVGALKNIADALRPGGKAIILVPAHHFLFNRLDTSAGHYRRYGKEELQKKMAMAGLRAEESFYFNAVSLPGWFFYGKVLGRRVIPASTPAILEPLIPLVSRFEKAVLKRRIGISLVTVASKRA